MAITDRVAETRSRFRDIVSNLSERPLWPRARRVPGSLTASQGISMAKLLSDYDIVETVHEEGVDPFIIVSKKFADGGHNTDSAAFGELGTAAPSPFTSQFRKEYNRELQGLEGLKRYDQMRRSDGTVRSTLRLVKTPVLAARWFVEPYRKKDEEDVKKVDQTAANFVEQCLFDEMSISWSQVLIEALLMADFGYYMFEIVWENRVVDGTMRTVIQKLAPRHPMDVITWEYDSNGGPAGVWMAGPTGFPQDDIFIPIGKLLIFSFDRECGNIEGISVLRSAYKHWYYKEQLYKIDAIQKERHGIGVPIIELPPGYSKADLASAQQLGRNLRTNERAHIVIPPLWKVSFAKLEGHVVDAIKSIEHHNREIEKNVLGTFIEGRAASTGKDDDQIMFLKATRFIADVVCEIFNLYLIPKLIDYNFTRANYPKLRARRIGEQADWRTISFAIRNLIGAGVLVPDDRLERYIRSEMDLPYADPKTARTVARPQGAPVGAQGVSAAAQAQQQQAGGVNPPTAPQAGPPRQAPPSTGAPSKNAGRDASGGK